MSAPISNSSENSSLWVLTVSILSSLRAAPRFSSSNLFIFFNINWPLISSLPFRKSLLSLLWKEGSSFAVSNYRPISFPNFSVIFEIIIQNHLSYFFQKKRLMLVNKGSKITVPPRTVFSFISTYFKQNVKESTYSIFKEKLQNCSLNESEKIFTQWHKWKRSEYKYKCK